MTIDPSSTSEPVIYPQHLLQQIDEACQRLDAAQELQTIEQRRTQAERVDANTLEVKQIKFRIQQFSSSDDICNVNWLNFIDCENDYGSGKGSREIGKHSSRY